MVQTSCEGLANPTLRRMKPDKRAPRRNSLVQLRPGGGRGRARGSFPFKRGSTYVFLGEIPNMPGHCVVADPRDGRVWAGYHTDNFSEVPDEEV